MAYDVLVHFSLSTLNVDGECLGPEAYVDAQMQISNWSHSWRTNGAAPQLWTTIKCKETALNADNFTPNGVAVELSNR